MSTNGLSGVVDLHPTTANVSVPMSGATLGNIEKIVITINRVNEAEFSNGQVTIGPGLERVVGSDVVQRLTQLFEASNTERVEKSSRSISFGSLTNNTPLKPIKQLSKHDKRNYELAIQYLSIDQFREAVSAAIQLSAGFYLRGLCSQITNKYLAQNKALDDSFFELFPLNSPKLDDMFCGILSQLKGSAYFDESFDNILDFYWDKNPREGIAFLKACFEVECIDDLLKSEYLDGKAQEHFTKGTHSHRLLEQLLRTYGSTEVNESKFYLASFTEEQHASVEAAFNAQIKRDVMQDRTELIRLCATELSIDSDEYLEAKAKLAEIINKPYAKFILDKPTRAFLDGYSLGKEAVSLHDNKH